MLVSIVAVSVERLFDSISADKIAFHIVRTVVSSEIPSKNAAKMSLIRWSL